MEDHEKVVVSPPSPGYFHLIYDMLLSIEMFAPWADRVSGELQLFKMDVRFLKAFCLWLETWDYSSTTTTDDDDESMERLRSLIIHPLNVIWPKVFLETWDYSSTDDDDESMERLRSLINVIWPKEHRGLSRLRRLAESYGTDMSFLLDFPSAISELEAKIQHTKQLFGGLGVTSFQYWSSFRCKPHSTMTCYKILEFLDSILQNLNDLVTYRAGEIVQFRKQIETLEDTLLFLKDFLKLAASNCRIDDGKELEEFNMFIQVFANDAACLTFLYWAKEVNDNFAFETNSMLSLMLQKIKPTSPGVARLYFETLKAIYVQRSDSITFGRIASSFADLLFEDKVTPTPLSNNFQLLRDDIVFLLTFLNDPSNENAEELICSQIDDLFWKGVYDLLPFDDMERDFSKKKVLLSDFMMRIETLNANIRHIYCKFPESSIKHNFPRVISPRFLDSLIHNLKNLKEWMNSGRNYVLFAKYKIIKIEEELVSLSHLFTHIFDLQSELSETWLEVVDLVHVIEHAINLCISSLFVLDHPIWYRMAYLFDVIDKIKVVKTKFEKIKENTMYLPRSYDFISTLPVEARPPEINVTIIGLEDEAEKIIGNLTTGRMSLDIVSIVGMGGLGKTTLARKVYGSSLVTSTFHVFAFCYVSQDYNIRRLLLDILCDIDGADDKLFEMTDDDLKHKLRKCLSGRKYLIVLDDIWNASVWNEVKSSFCDNHNRSRVMITTRDSEVAEKCKIDCCPHQLRFLSEVESWNLFQKKVFHNDISPPDLSEIGKLIATNCKGLPLAIIVIAGLLARTERNLSWWSEVAERVVSYLSDEGCMKFLELSYRHLPGKLKPCLLYLGAFPEDSLIRVNHVILLWIAEGFVQESETKCIEDVAKEYFHDLVDRSFIIVSGRSSNSEIKTFRVHDLIHEFCQMKCRDVNFFLLDHGMVSSTSSGPSTNNHYRISSLIQRDDTDGTDESSPLIQEEDTDGTAESSLLNVQSVLHFGEHHDEKSDFPFSEFRFARVLHFNVTLQDLDIEQLSKLVHLRYIHARVTYEMNSIPSSISNLWNVVSLTLDKKGIVYLPETIWRMNSLRHVKVGACILKFSDGGFKQEGYPILDKVVSFSTPLLFTAIDIQRLMQRLPAVRKLSCRLAGQFFDYDEESAQILKFDKMRIESLKLTQTSYVISPCLINFPPTLKKLILLKFELHSTAIPAIAKLKCLQVLKLIQISFQPEQRLDMEDLIFENLIFFELHTEELEEWNASTESFPKLEQLVIDCKGLEELPPCFGEIPPLLKKIVVTGTEQLQSSAVQTQEEQRALGNEVEVECWSFLS